MAPRIGCAAMSLHRSVLPVVTIGLICTIAGCGETPLDTNGDNGHTETSPRLSITPTTLTFTDEQGGSTTPQWFENGATELHIKRWRGFRWDGIGRADFGSAGRHVHLATSDTELYVTYTTKLVHVQMDMYDGFSWTALESPSDPPPLDDSYNVHRIHP